MHYHKYRTYQNPVWDNSEHLSINFAPSLFRRIKVAINTFVSQVKDTWKLEGFDYTSHSLCSC